MNKSGFLVIFLSIFFSCQPVESSDFFHSHWVSLNIGRTNGAFKSNSGNEKGIGLFFRAGFSSSIYKNIFVTYQKSKVTEFHALMAEVYNPLEYFTQSAFYAGYSITLKDFCFLPAIGYCWMQGINRGEWLGEIGVESNDCQRLPYNSNGIPWYFQVNTNSDGWIGIISGTINSKKDYWGILLFLKLGKQIKK